jgi:hypothetical protein
MEKYIEPKVKNGLYIFTETLCGGYLNRGQNASYTYETTWNKDLQLIKITADGTDVGYFFDDKGKLRKDIEKYGNGKGNLDFSIFGIPSLRARNRHLKYLKIFLGLQPKEEVKEEKFIYRDNGWWANSIEIGEKEVTQKGSPNFGNCRFMSWVKWSEEKEKLAKEYNRIQQEKTKELTKLHKLIFGE